jgi:hypothetical protein
MRYVSSIAIAVLMGFCSFVGVAFAADAATPSGGESVLDLARPVLDAIMSGHYAAAAALALVLAVALARRYGSPRLPWLNSDEGGAILVLTGSFGGAMATALLAGAAPTLSLAWMSLQVAAGGAGIYVLAKKLLHRPLLWLQDKAPSWLKPILSLVLWIFERPSTAEKAAKAGDAAVEANPPGGIEGTLGKPEERP